MDLPRSSCSGVASGSGADTSVSWGGSLLRLITASGLVGSSPRLDEHLLGASRVALHPAGEPTPKPGCPSLPLVSGVYAVKEGGGAYDAMAIRRGFAASNLGRRSSRIPSWYVACT